MGNILEKQLSDLERISYKMSDLINDNEFSKIMELDIKRNEIIKKIYKNHSKNFSDRVFLLLKKNEDNIKKTEEKIIQLKKNKNKFFKRLKAYKN